MDTAEPDNLVNFINNLHERIQKEYENANKYLSLLSKTVDAPIYVLEHWAEVVKDTPYSIRSRYDAQSLRHLSMALKDIPEFSGFEISKSSQSEIKVYIINNQNKICAASIDVKEKTFYIEFTKPKAENYTSHYIGRKSDREFYKLYVPAGTRCTNHRSFKNLLIMFEVYKKAHFFEKISHVKKIGFFLKLIFKLNAKIIKSNVEEMKKRLEKETEYVLKGEKNYKEYSSIYRKEKQNLLTVAHFLEHHGFICRKMVKIDDCYTMVDGLPDEILE